MNLREEILRESIGYTGNSFEDNLFFNKLAKGFITDYKVFGEDTASFYSDVFGPEFSIIFEEFQDNIEVLEEEVKIDSPFVRKLPGAPELGARCFKFCKKLTNFRQNSRRSKTRKS